MTIDVKHVSNEKKSRLSTKLNLKLISLRKLPILQFFIEAIESFIKHFTNIGSIIILNS